MQISTKRALYPALIVTAVMLATAFFYSLAFAAHGGNDEITVSGDTAAGENEPGWLFNRDPANATPIEFNTDEASIGAGSLYVLPIGTTSAHKFIGENFLLTPIADVESVSYDFLIGSGGTAADAHQFYMNVYANFGTSSDTKFFDCRYDVIPVLGSTADWTTVTFDPTEDYLVTTSGSSPFPCPTSPADMDALSPDSNIRAFSLNLGDTTASDVGLDGYFDNVVTVLSDGTTVYDFEPAPASKDECKSGGWMDFGFQNQGQCVSFTQSGHDNR